MVLEQATTYMNVHGCLFPVLSLSRARRPECLKKPGRALRPSRTCIRASQAYTHHFFSLFSKVQSGSQAHVYVHHSYIVTEYDVCFHSERRVQFSLQDTRASLAATLQIAPSYMLHDKGPAPDVPRILRRSISDFKVT